MIDFQNAKILGYTHSHEYLGSLFRFGVRKNISIEGEFYEFENESGVQPIWAGISGFVGSAQDYDSIILNGIDFGYGSVEDLSFDSANDVRRKSYKANITIFETGNLFNLTGVNYSGIKDINVPFELLETFSESFSTDIGEDKKGKVEQSINIKFISGAATGGNADPKYLARVLASGLRYSPKVIPFILNGYPNLNLGNKVYSTESYNKITNECSFTFTSNLGSGNSYYSSSFTNSIDLNSDGFCTVSERGDILGLSGDLFASANLGYTAERAAAFPRCEGLYEAYNSGGSGLNAYPIKSNKTNDHFAGRISYDLIFSDDLKYLNEYTWEYTHNLKRGNGCIYEVSEDGSILGRLSECEGNRYENAQDGWQIVQSGINSRVSGYYQDTTSLTKPLKLVQKSIKKSEIEGNIGYSYSFTDNSFYNISGFRKIDYTVSDTYPVHLANKLSIINVGEVVQPAYIPTTAERSLSFNVVGQKSKSINDYTSLFKNIANTLIPSGTDTHIKSTNYNFNPLQNAFEGSISWTWFGDRAFADVTI